MGEPNNPLDVMTFADDRCFLCGKLLEGTETREHVFPKWLLNQGNLKNCGLTLLNRTKIPYKDLTIPCCAECNNVHLGSIEKEISQAFASGYEAVKELDSLKLFQWMAKMLYGIIYKEVSLKVDRRASQENSILNFEVLQEYKIIHQLLQSARIPFVFDNGKPWSIIVTKIHKYEEAGLNFDYRDGFPDLVVGLRMNGVGVIANLFDNGMQQNGHIGYWNDLRSMTLHPVQWEESWIRFFEEAKRMNWFPKYSIAFGDVCGKENPVHFINMPPLGRDELFLEENKKFIAEECLKSWSRYNPDLTLDDVFLPPDELRTFIHRADGSLNHMSADGFAIY